MSQMKWLFVLVGLSAVAAYADIKLGYVDLQRALVEVNEGREAKSRLQSMLQAKQIELDREQNALRKESESLEKQASMMNEETRLAKQNALREKLMVLTQKLEKGKAEMAEMERTELNTIFQKMEPIIKQLAMKEGLTMVLEKTDSGIVYAPPSLDLTDQLVFIYNDQNKGGANKAKAPKPETLKK